MSERYALVDLMNDIGFGANQPISTIVHIVETPLGYRVVQAGRMADGLAFDEMLGQVVDLLHPKLGAGRYAMKTRDEIISDAARHEARMAAIGEKETAQ